MLLLKKQLLLWENSTLGSFVPFAMPVYSFSNAMPLIFICFLFLNKRYVYTKMRTLQHQHLSLYQHKYWRRSNIYQHQIMERLFFCFLFVDGGRPANLVNFYQSCYIVSQIANFYSEVVFFKNMCADIGWYYAYFFQTQDMSAVLTLSKFAKGQGWRGALDWSWLTWTRSLTSHTESDWGGRRRRRINAKRRWNCVNILCSLKRYQLHDQQRKQRVVK